LSFTEHYTSEGFELLTQCVDIEWANVVAIFGDTGTDDGKDEPPDVAVGEIGYQKGFIPKRPCTCTSTKN